MEHYFRGQINFEQNWEHLNKRECNIPGPFIIITIICIISVIIVVVFMFIPRFLSAIQWPLHIFIAVLFVLRCLLYSIWDMILISIALNNSFLKKNTFPVFHVRKWVRKLFPVSCRCKYWGCSLPTFKREMNYEINEITFIPQQSQNPPQRKRTPSSNSLNGSIKANWYNNINLLGSKNVKRKPWNRFLGSNDPHNFLPAGHICGRGKEILHGSIWGGFLCNSFSRSLLRGVGKHVGPN